jgi:REP element-mobilizing transposase RayT
MDERKYNPEGHHRRSIRLPGTDYSQSGAYFVTLCTQNRACLFGEIRNGKMELNDAGQMVMKWYDELENKFSDITNDECFCMPNHFHGIVLIKDDCGKGHGMPCPYG